MGAPFPNACGALPVGSIRDPIEVRWQSRAQGPAGVHRIENLTEIRHSTRELRGRDSGVRSRKIPINPSESQGVIARPMLPVACARL